MSNVFFTTFCGKVKYCLDVRPFFLPLRRSSHKNAICLFERRPIRNEGCYCLLRLVLVIDRDDMCLHPNWNFIKAEQGTARQGEKL